MRLTHGSRKGGIGTDAIGRESGLRRNRDAIRRVSTNRRRDARDAQAEQRLSPAQFGFLFDSLVISLGARCIQSLSHSLPRASFPLLSFEPPPVPRPPLLDATGRPTPTPVAYARPYLQRAKPSLSAIMSASVNVLPLGSSLLNRRAATHNPAVPTNLSVPALVPLSPPPPAPTTFPRANPRRPSAGFLSFTPLPPIMASPTLTPELAHASSSAAVLDTAARKLVPGHANSSMIPPAPPQPVGDYVTHHPFPPNPTWTTCPPTPPPKGPSSSRLAPPTPPCPVGAVDSQWSAHADRASPPPGSVEPSQARSPVLTTSPSLSALSSGGRHTRASARRLSLPTDLSSPLPRRPGAYIPGAPESLPPLPLAPIDRDRDELQESLLPSISRRAPMIQDAMSLTPRVAPAYVSPGPGPSACETGVARRVGRKLFNLDAEEGDASEEEEAEHLQGAYKVQKRSAREGDTVDLADLDPDPDTERNCNRETEMGRAWVQEQQRERAERLRRYHALMELLTTEVGYLFDLRALVTVYLDQLLLLSTPTSPGSTGPSSLAPPPLAASPQQSLGVAAPGRSMSTFSALSIPSLFPSSRSSFLQPSPLPTPSVSADYLSNSTSDCGSLQERERHTSCPPPSSDGGSREREREGSNRILTLKHGKSRTFGPLLSEKEARAICRNAQDLLRYHERFVGELRDAVSVTSFRVAFEEGNQGRTQRADEVATEEVERTIELVAAKFVDEASSFSVYETFCPGHNAAGDVVRRVQERFPSAWDAYEQRCALLASNVSPGSRPDETKEESDLSPTSPTSTEMEDVSSLEPFATVAKRRHSTPIGFPSSASSLPDITARSQLPFPTSSPSSATFALPTPERRVRWTGHKLKLTDFLIKPVQRICKYPLLLDQLKDKRQAQSVSDDEKESDMTDCPGEALGRATEAMREVTSRVNRASEKEAHNLRSALIHSRLMFTNPPLPSSTGSGSSPAAQSSSASSPSSSECASSSHGHSNPVSMSSGSAASSAPTSPGSAGASQPVPVPAPAPGPRLAYLTADFVSSLGPCLLAGALDVVQHPVQRAKYLGAFLYAGGYCILAKIPKGGRVYEPRHWFALSEVEVVDIEEDDPLYPYTFRVSGYGHHLQLAASCSQEKAIWMAVINDALSTKRTWAREPLSSLQADDKSPTIAPSATVVEDPPPDDSLRRLSTIQSNSELEKLENESEMSHDTVSTYPSPVKLRYSKTTSRLDGIPGAKSEHYYSQNNTFSAALSRRSSTASVKAFFAPIAFDLRIARPNGQVRGQVESGLHDVFSESCLAVRAQAQMRGEELFQVRVLAPGRSRQQATVPRSSSGISLANAMGFSAAKRKYDNVLVSRRKSSVDLDVHALPVPALPGYATNMLADTAGPAPSESGGLSFRSKTLAARRQRRPPTSIAPAISTAIAQMNAEQQERPAGPLVQSPDPLTLDSPFGVSRCSSISSVLPSPVDMSPLPIPTPEGVRLSDGEPSIQRGRQAVPKRSRSVVDNVRSLFHSPRSRSASSSSGRASPSPVMMVDTPSSSDSSSSIMQWLRRASLRRGRTSASSSSANSIVDGHLGHGDSRRRMPSRTSTDSVAMRNQYLDVPRPRGTRDHYNCSPKRHRSLFVSSTSSRSRANGVTFRDDTMRERGMLASSNTNSTSSLSARRSLKNLLLFQRANAMTPVDVGPSHSR